MVVSEEPACEQLAGLVSGAPAPVPEDVRERRALRRYGAGLRG
jgi:hypothetical protein